MAYLGKKYQYRSDKSRYFQTFFAEFYDSHRRPNRKRVPLNTTDKTAARQLLTQLERDVAMGLLDPWLDRRTQDGLLFGEAVARFVKSRESYCSPSTTATYRYVLGSFAEQLKPGFPLTGVEQRHIQAFLKRDLADATRRGYAQRLRVFFTWCVKQGLLKENPVSAPERSKRSRRADLPEYLTEDHLARLVTAIEADAVLKVEIDSGNQWLLDAVLFTVNTGLRRGELCSLRWSAVNLADGLITVANTDNFTTKSGRERSVPLVGTALEIVERLSEARPNEDDRESVFRGASGGPINGHYLSKRFRFYRTEAGLPKTINFHSLRHTFASWAVMRGMDLYLLKEILGHSDIKQTQVYAHLRPDTLRQAMETAFGGTATGLI